MRFLRASISLLVAVVVAASSGCDARDPVLRLAEVAPPEGGSVYTIASVAAADGPTLVAPSEHALFLRSGEQWAGVQAQLMPSFRLAPLAELRSSLGESTFPTKRFFVGWKNRLWFVTGGVGSNEVWASSDLGRTWTEVVLPRTDASEESRSAIAATDPYRLVAAEELYLIHGRHIWAYSEREPDVQWVPVSLEGVVFDDASVPAVIRNYLPREAGRDFEMLTVLSDQLRIYRRVESDGPWILTSTFSQVDRDLITVPATDTVFLLSTDALYRSDDQGEQWFRAWPADHQAALTCISTVRGDEAAAPDGLLVGAADGTIWRSSIAALEWEKVYERSEGGRPITGFQVDGKGDLWASSLGEGTLRSTDGGLSWSLARTGLTAARPLDSEIEEGRLVLGTEAGIYGLSGEGDESRWERFHDAPVSTLTYDRVEKVRWAGLLDGRILRFRDDAVDELTWESEKSFEVEIQPSRFDRYEIPARAVVALSLGPESRAIAGTHRRGFALRSPEEEWSSWKLPSALVIALSRTTVLNTFLGEDSSVYLTERSISRSTPTQLWKTVDRGETWSAVHSFAPQSDLGAADIRPVDGLDGDELVAASGGELWRSADGGERWNKHPGPWENGTITALSVRSATIALLTDLGRYSALFVMEDSSANPRRFNVIWPEGMGRERVQALFVTNRKVHVVTTRTVYVGTMPIGDGRYDGQGIFIAVLVLGLGILLGFGALKRWG